MSFWSHFPCIMIRGASEFVGAKRDGTLQTLKLVNQSPRNGCSKNVIIHPHLCSRCSIITSSNHTTGAQWTFEPSPGIAATSYASFTLWELNSTGNLCHKGWLGGVCSELLYILDATIFVASRSDGVKLTALLIDGCLELFFVENLGRTSEVNDITYI